jgi:hypothetical protein
VEHNPRDLPAIQPHFAHDFDAGSALLSGCRMGKLLRSHIARDDGRGGRTMTTVAPAFGPLARQEMSCPGFWKSRPSTSAREKAP